MLEVENMNFDEFEKDNKLFNNAEEIDFDHDYEVSEEDVYYEDDYSLPSDYEDVNKDGSLEVFRVLYDVTDFEGPHIGAFLRNDEVFIEWSGTNIDGFIFVHKVMKGIPADELKKCLKASDYIKMMDNLKEKYSDFFAFNRILSFLSENHIKYELTVESEDLVDWTDLDDLHI